MASLRRRNWSHDQTTCCNRSLLLLLRAKAGRPLLLRRRGRVFKPSDWHLQQENSLIKRGGYLFAVNVRETFSSSFRDAAESSRATAIAEALFRAKCTRNFAAFAKHLRRQSRFAD